MFFNCGDAGVSPMCFTKGSFFQEVTFGLLWLQEATNISVLLRDGALDQKMAPYTKAEWPAFWWALDSSCITLLLLFKRGHMFMNVNK